MPDSSDSLEAYENAPPILGRELLRRAGYEPVAPDLVEDGQIRGCLWELIYALAARRVFLRHTDQLDDHGVYEWLHDAWLDRETRDLPPESRWTSQICPDRSRPRTESMMAAEKARPWFDRDRFLPTAPETPDPVGSAGLPEWAGADEGPGEPPFDTTESGDPLGLHAVDREIRAEQRKAAAKEAASPSGPPLHEEHEMFERVAKIDRDGWQRPHEELARTGVVLLPPDEITDETIGPRLWELLHELACRDFYVLNSDHLSDREIYTHLWREDLRAPAILPGRSKHGGWFHDFVGNGSEESTQVWLRFFASDDDRARRAREWPETLVPPRETPRFKRDWRLPKGPF